MKIEVCPLNNVEDIITALNASIKVVAADYKDDLNCYTFEDVYLLENNLIKCFTLEETINKKYKLKSAATYVCPEDTESKKRTINDFVRVGLLNTYDLVCIIDEDHYSGEIENIEHLQVILQ